MLGALALKNLISYLANLAKVGVRSGSIPGLVRLHKAFSAGDIPRREFFRRVALIRQEAKAQAAIMRVGQKFDDNRKAGSLWLSANKNLLNKIKGASKSAKGKSEAIYAREVRNKKIKLSASSRGEVRKQHKSMMQYLEDEAYFESPRSPLETFRNKNYIKLFYNKEHGRKTFRQMVDDVIEWDEYMGGGSSRLYAIEDGVKHALLKRLGITPEMLRKIADARQMARSGYGSGLSSDKTLSRLRKAGYNVGKTINKGKRALASGSSGSGTIREHPLLTEWFNAREKLMKITGQSTTQMGDYSMQVPSKQHWNFSRPQGYKIEGLDEVVKDVNETAKAIGKVTENKFKTIWQGLKDEYNKGKFGIEEIDI